MRRKIPVTFNLPARVRVMAEAYAEANGMSFSSYLEDLIRDDMRKAGVNVNLPPAELLAAMEKWVSELGSTKTRRPARKRIINGKK